MSKTVSAIFDNHADANIAINSLREKGYSDKDISILAADGSYSKDIKIEKNTKSPEGASIGAGLGAAAGATLAGLTAVGTITLTGGAALLAAGPVVAALAGAGAGAGAGGIIGGLAGLGFPETEAKLIDKKIGKGHVMLAVTVEDEEKNRMKEFFEESNSVEVTVL